ncbi:hypothetical protein VKT23_003468 [Stygiomarasmius scandens]|uniref:C2H2-type domain-containing protein n=1 Tax=Marasmiellus scandens TaxID=2682957 RepID=A0ABR1JY29_9AGAR
MSYHNDQWYGPGASSSGQPDVWDMCEDMYDSGSGFPEARNSQALETAHNSQYQYSMWDPTSADPNFSSSQFPTAMASASFYKTANVRDTYSYPSSASQSSQATGTVHNLPPLQIPEQVRHPTGASAVSPHSLSSLSAYPPHHNWNVPIPIPETRRASGPYFTSPSSPDQHGVSFDSNANRPVGTAATRRASQRRRRNKDVVGKYVCDICSQDFTAAHNLRHHKNSHMGVRPFGCDVCGAEFGTLHVLARHKRAKH